MADYVVNRNAGRKVEKNQTARLGDVAMDVDGNIWSYVKFAEECKPGEVLRDTVSADIISSSGVGSVTAAAEVGSTILEDDGEFKDDDFVGAVGFITAGAGKGQSFKVTKMIDTDKIRIELLASATDFPKRRQTKGWSVALATSSRYALIFPGWVRKGGGISSVIRGVSEVEVRTKEIGYYGWLKQEGLSFGKLDASADAPTVGDWMVATAAGLIKGLDATAPANLADVPTHAKQYSAVIGQCLAGDVTGTDDVLIPVNLSIRNHTLSYKFHKTQPALNQVEVRR